MTETGTLIIGLPGTTLSPQDKQWISHPAVAGIILFTHNFESKSQIQSYNDAIREVREDVFICVDHEGGRVQRFRPGFTEIPPMGTLGIRYKTHPDEALKTAKEYGEIIANELLEVGVDFTFAPVLDLDYGKSSVIGNRAFDADPEVVSALAGSFIAGLHAHDMAVCGKHFPGHGFVTPDSHVADPVDPRSLEDIMNSDIIPYKRLVNELDSLMTAHILFPEVDSEIVSYSSFWLKTILRQELGYEGLIISDDLVMHAAAKQAPIDRVHKALNAGCDYVLYCQDYQGIQSILDAIK
jgi:beta-N-acetylhexosaminidase